MPVPVLLADWGEPLPREERNALLDKAATLVTQRGLEAPTIWALEMHKPLAFLGSQAVLVGGPMFGPLVGLERMQTLSRLLAEDGVVEDLIARIEEKAAAREAKLTPATKKPRKSRNV